ncbi:MAG: DUF1727 domain-containing protein [Peptostreptococcaceae bacterium]|nr:DUF1727 domain-containing protein [Peptostreptococcaceae bacterium]
MHRIRFFIALWGAKGSKILLKITRNNGTNFPGKIAIKICPDFLKYINKPKKIIGVTGTNGKTTVANLAIDMLEYDGEKVLNNSLGSNTITGIVTSLINGVSLSGKSKYEKGVFEIDEKSTKRIFPEVTPDYLLVTNLSRDSIMRNGHPEYISKILTKYIPKATKLIINADDLISSNISPENERVYFGIDKMDTDKTECTNLINDLQICPKCHSKLSYDYLRYHHMGKAVCNNCGFSSPESDYLGENVNLTDMTIDIKEAGDVNRYRLLNDSVFNIYNVVSIVALFRELGYSHDKTKKLLEKVNIISSRYNVKEIDDKKVFMQMTKDRNAFACTRVFDYISSLPGEKELIIMMSNLDDAKHWSENTCWLYDCDFELLNKDNIKNIVVVGPRSKDYYLRILFAGIDGEKVVNTMNELDAPNYLKLFENDNIYILYGTDSIELASLVKEKVETRIRGGN